MRLMSLCCTPMTQSARRPRTEGGGSWQDWNSRVLAADMPSTWGGAGVRAVKCQDCWESGLSGVKTVRSQVCKESGLSGVRTQNCQESGLLGVRIVRSQDCRESGLSGVRSVRSQESERTGVRTVGSQDCQELRLSGVRTLRSQDCKESRLSRVRTVRQTFGNHVNVGGSLPGPAHQNIYVPATADFLQNCACQNENELLFVFSTCLGFFLLVLCYLKFIPICLLKHY